MSKHAEIQERHRKLAEEIDTLYPYDVPDSLDTVPQLLADFERDTLERAALVVERYAIGNGQHLAVAICALSKRS